jgi:hypothetical protein
VLQNIKGVDRASNNFPAAANCGFLEGSLGFMKPFSEGIIQVSVNPLYKAFGLNF